METKFTYYLGLDMGTDSLGWAVTDSSYHILSCLLYTSDAADE